MGDLIRWIGIGSGANDPVIKPRYLDFTNEEEGNTDQDISLLSTCGVRGSQNMPMNLESDEPTPNSEGRRGRSPNSDGGNLTLESSGLTPGSRETATTGGTSEVTLEDVLRERDELRRQREEMKRRLANRMMEDQDKLNYDGNTVRIGGRRPVYSGVDAANYTKVTETAVKIFQNIKMLPLDWHKYSLVENSVCDRILKNGVTVPYEYSSEFYFCNVLRKQFLCKYRSMKTNFNTVWREEFIGECCLSISMFSYLHLSHKLPHY